MSNMGPPHKARATNIRKQLTNRTFGGNIAVDKRTSIKSWQKKNKNVLKVDLMF